MLYLVQAAAVQEDKQEGDVGSGGIDGNDLLLTAAALSSLPDTIEVFSFNRSFEGVFYLRQYLTACGR